MAEFIEEASGLESTTIGIYRTAATVKGGRRFSFSALVAVGDRQGTVGIGYGKAPAVPAAIEKAQKSARKELKKVNLLAGTLPHQSLGRFNASSIKLIPASPGTGVIAGGTARAVLELAGVKDCLTKSMGSNNQKNLARAVLDGLVGMRTKEQVAALRGVEIEKTEVEEKLERGSRFAPAPTSDAAPAPEKKEAAAESKGKGRGKGRGKGGRDDKPRQQGPGGTGIKSTVRAVAKKEPKKVEEPKVETPAPEAPAAEAPKTEAPKTDDSPKAEGGE